MSVAKIDVAVVIAKNMPMTCNVDRLVDALS